MVAHDEVLDVLVLSKVGHFLVVDELFDATIDRSLSGAHSVVSELDQGRFLTHFLVFAVIDVEHDDAFASRQVHALDFDRWEHRLEH